MDDAEKYVLQLQRRAVRLESLVNHIKHMQNKAARKRTIERHAFTDEIQALLRSVEELEQEISSLARATKKFITIFQRFGVETQLATLQERVDMLQMENLITKKELRRIIAA